MLSLLHLNLYTAHLPSLYLTLASERWPSIHNSHPIYLLLSNASVSTLSNCLSLTSFSIIPFSLYDKIFLQLFVWLLLPLLACALSDTGFSFQLIALFFYPLLATETHLFGSTQFTPKYIPYFTLFYLSIHH